MGVVQHSRPAEVARGVRRRGAVWITWQRHRRTRELCRALSIDLCELTWRAPRLLRYPVLLAGTAICLARRRPAIVFIQCPSILLGAWAGLLKRPLGYRLVADLHNEAVEPYNYTFAAYRALVGWIARLADVCLVTNDPLGAVVERSGGRPFVLPDKVPALSPGPDPEGHRAADGARRVVFVCSFAPDEPYLEVIEAARQLGPAARVFVTGNPAKLDPSMELPANVELTGYLPEEEYEALLRGADVIVDLTRMEDCLVCGAYEAVAVERPLVTSDTTALRRHFRRGTVYTGHEPAALAAAIASALADRARLAGEMRTLKAELQWEWAARQEGLQRRLAALDSEPGLV